MCCNWRSIDSIPKTGEFLVGVWEGSWDNPYHHFRVYHATGFKSGPVWANKSRYRTEEGEAYVLSCWAPFEVPAR